LNKSIEHINKFKLRRCGAYSFKKYYWIICQWRYQ